MVESLTWYAKPFGPGDIDGQGARRLLGQPALPPLAMLVRETAQNSWDARVPGRTVRYTLHLRTLTPAQTEVLRSRVLTSDPPGLGLSTSLEREQVTVLEILDGGTTGLAGPVRNDLEVPDGQPTDFIDLVFSIGAPRDTHLGGGTYGFGKTITYVLSRAGTVLIHSRTDDPTGPAVRFIGSAVGDHFDLDGRRYTGRHWWGVRPTPDRIEPLTGDDGDELAGEVFDSLPARDDSGTSIMIIEPDLGGRSIADAGRALADAVLWHLWPKLVPEDPDTPAMRFDVLVDGQPLSIPDPRWHPILKGHVEALSAVRAVQNGSLAPAGDYPTTVTEIRSGRPKVLLGHLGFTRYDAPPRLGIPASTDGEENGTDADVPISDRSHHVTLMRHGAELVVKYLDRQPLPSPVLHWAAVFKPVDAVDDYFAMAEPPAHDDWVPDAVKDHTMRSGVRVALRRINDSVTAELRPAYVVDDATGETVSAAHLADTLAGLVMSARGTRAVSTPQRATRIGTRTRAVPQAGRADAVDRRTTAGSDGWVRHAILFEIGAPDSTGVHAVPDVRIAYDGGRETDPDACRAIGFRSDGGEAAEELHLLPGEQCSWWVVVEAREDLAVDVDVTIRAEGFGE